MFAWQTTPRCRFHEQQLKWNSSPDVLPPLFQKLVSAAVLRTVFIFLTKTLMACVVICLSIVRTPPPFHAETNTGVNDESALVPSLPLHLNRHLYRHLHRLRRPHHRQRRRPHLGTRIILFSPLRNKSLVKLYLICTRLPPRVTVAMQPIQD